MAKTELEKAQEEAEKASAAAEKLEKENAELKERIAKAEAGAKKTGMKVYIFPGDDAVVMNVVTYKGGLLVKDEKGKETERAEADVRICGQNIVLKKNVPVLMSRACQIVLGKFKQIKVERQKE
jgi:hypothetical protein